MLKQKIENILKKRGKMTKNDKNNEKNAKIIKERKNNFKVQK